MKKVDSLNIKLKILGVAILWTSAGWLIYSSLAALLPWIPRKPFSSFLTILILPLVYPVVFTFLVRRRTGLVYRSPYGYFAPVLSLFLTEIIPLTFSSTSPALFQIGILLVSSMIVSFAFWIFDIVLEKYLEDERIRHATRWQTLDKLSFQDFLLIRMPSL